MPRLPLLALFALAGCARPAAAPPTAEFVIATGDSSYWVRAGAFGIELRRAPLVLARIDGRLHELYVTEEDQSFYDALFVSQTVWRRDLLTNDSTVVYADSTVPRLATDYARAHPDVVPLDADEGEAEDPAVLAAVEVEFVALHGPFVTLETFADLHPGDGTETHRTRRTVIDLRSGTPVTLAALLGDSAGAQVVAEGRAALRRARDSILGRGDVVDRRAAAALARFTFDPASFALTSVRRQPGVVFFVPGSGEDADGYALPLPAITVSAGAWWDEASGTLPDADRDAAAGAWDARARPARAVERWTRPGYTVLARRPAGDERRTLVLQDSLQREWPLATMGSAAPRIYWLDTPPVSAAERRALSQAFYDASLYGSEVRAVAGTSSGRTKHYAITN